jgi:hypothetical protein
LVLDAIKKHLICDSLVLVWVLRDTRACERDERRELGPLSAVAISRMIAA